MKEIIFLVWIIGQFSNAQRISYEYGFIQEFEYNRQQEEYILLEESVKKMVSLVWVNEESKLIFISRDVFLTNGETNKSMETYYYVKMERNGKEDYRFYGVDLLNKKYLEFSISPEATLIAENCNGLTGCRNLTALSN